MAKYPGMFIRDWRGARVVEGTGLENQYEPFGNVRLGATAGGVAGLGLGAKEYLDDQTNTVEHCLRSRG